MATQQVQHTPIGGMVASDMHADPSKDAYLDVNGWFDGDKRYAVRPGIVALDAPSGGVDHLLTYRGVYAFKALNGQTRLIYAADVIKAGNLAHRYGTVALARGNIVIVVLDPAYERYATAPTPANRRIGVGKIPVVAEPAPWEARFFEDREYIYCAGHSSGMVRFAKNVLRSDVIADTIDGVLTNGLFAGNSGAWAAGDFTSIYGYLTGNFGPGRVFTIGSATWYVPTRAQWFAGTVPFDPIQESIPQRRISPDMLSLQLDERSVVFSESENPLGVRALYSSFFAPNNRIITAVASTGDSVNILFDDGALAVDIATLGQQSIKRHQYGTSAPYSVQELDERIVFVNRAGLVAQTAAEEKVVTSPALDALFKGTMKSPLPVPLAGVEAQLGLPWRVDFDRLHLARSFNDCTRGWYGCAVTTVGSYCTNDLLIVWDYRYDRVFLHKGTDVLPGTTRRYVQSYTGAVVNIEQFFSSAFCFTDIATARFGDSQTDIYFCNDIGVWRLWDGELDYLYYRLHNHATHVDTWDLAENGLDIHSVRVTPAYMLSDYNVKNAPVLRATLAENVFVDNGAARIYVEGEGGSNQVLTAAQLSSPNPYPSTTQATTTELVRREEKRPHWGMTGETWDGTRVWAKPDYVVLDAAINWASGRWFRVTYYDKRNATCKPALNLISAEVDIGVVRAV